MRAPHLARSQNVHDARGTECNQLVLVSVRRRGKRMRPARDSLESALEIFEELGAAL
jgi:hypothetical protein